MSLEVFTEKFTDTKRIGRIFGEETRKRTTKKGALIIALIGDLGGGKTTFIQGFARGLGIKQKILSPTFVLMKKFKIPEKGKKLKNKSAGFEYFYHLDCYRINNPEEISILSLEKLMLGSKNILAIEWAERIKKIIPRNSVRIKFEFMDENKRKIIFK